MAALRLARPRIAAAHNEPYAVDDASDYTIPVHGEKRRVPSVLIEIRNDLIATPAQQNEWALLLSKSLRESVAALNQEGY